MKKLYTLLLCLALLVHASCPALAEDAALPASVAVDEAPAELGEADLPSDGSGVWNVAPGLSTNALPDALQLGVKETYALSVKGATYKSSKASVASVSKKGVVTAKKKGKATITATVGGDVVGTCAVSVLAAPKKVTLSEAKLVLITGDVRQLEAKLPKNTASQIKWSSSDKSIATVNGKGLVTALKRGTVKITAKTFNGHKATCAVAVWEPDDPTTVAFSPKALSIGVKESVKATPVVNDGAKPAYKWTTKSKSIATVTKGGVITGKKKGSTKITVTTQNGLKATLSVKVLKAPSKVALSASEATLGINGVLRLTAKLPKDTASQIAWQSDVPGVASVDAGGAVTGVAPGSATITATTFNGKTASCRVTVTSAVEPTAVVIAGSGKVAIDAGEAYPLDVSLLPEGAETTLSFTSSNPSVATVSASGLVVGRSAGEAIITATAANGKSASVTVAVRGSADAGLRDALAGDWNVTAAVVYGLDAATCLRLITLNLRADSSAYLQFHGNGGLPGGGFDCKWTLGGGVLSVKYEGVELLSLTPSPDGSRLAYIADGDLIYYFTRGIDPDPYYYAKYDVAPADVNGAWVADRVSVLTLGLTFSAQDLGLDATVSVNNDLVTLKYRSDDGDHTLETQVRYANGMLEVLDWDDKQIVSSFRYYPALDALCCQIGDEKYYFKRQ